MSALFQAFQITTFRKNRNGPPHVARAAGLAELAAEETDLPCSLTPDASLRIFEELLNGFDLIDEEIAAERRRVGDPEALARILLHGEVR